MSGILWLRMASALAGCALAVLLGCAINPIPTPAGSGGADAFAAPDAVRPATDIPMACDAQAPPADLGPQHGDAVVADVPAAVDAPSLPDLPAEDGLAGPDVAPDAAEDTSDAVVEVL